MKKLFALILTLMMSLTLAACGEDLEDELVDITLQSDVEEAELTQDPAEATEGMEVTVTASEVEGYDFQRWIDADTDDELSTDMNYTFTVEEDVTLEAVYEEDDTNGNGGDTYTVDTSTDLESADLTVSEDGPYEEGDEITVDAPDVDTYNFVRWINADTDEELSTDQSYTFTVEENLNLEAVYEDTLNEDERTAQTIVDESSEDMANLDTMMEDFDPAEGMTTTMHMAMEQEDPDSDDPIVYDMEVELATNMDDDDNRISKLSVTMDMPDMDESMTMTMFMEESEDSVTYTMDAGMLIDMMESDPEMDADLRNLFDLENDYVYLTVPKDIEGSDMEVVQEQLMDAIYVQMLGPDYDESEVPELDDETMTNFVDQLDSIKDFMNFSTLSSYDDFDLEMERNGAIAEGTFTIGGESLKDFMEDLVEEVYTDLESMDETGEMQPYDEFTSSSQYLTMMALVESMQIPVTMEYNAEDETLFMDVNMNTLLDNLSSYDSEGSLDTIQDITMEMTMEKGTTIDDDLSDAKNLEVIGEEIIKVMTVADTSTYLGSIAEDTDLSAGTYTVNELETMGMGHYLTLPFIDKEESEVTIDDSEDTLSVGIDLYYAHDESQVFVDSPLTLSDISAVMDEEPTTREDVVDIMDLVDDNNFDLYPILGETMARMIEESQLEDDIPDSDAFPEEDQEDIEEPTLFDRYDPSYAVYYDTEGSQEFYEFVADTNSEDVREHFSTTLVDDGWTEETNQENTQNSSVDYDMYYTNETEGYGISISIMPDSGYDTGIRYNVTVQPLE